MIRDGERQSKKCQRDRAIALEDLWSSRDFCSRLDLLSEDLFLSKVCHKDFVTVGYHHRDMAERHLT